MSKKIEKIILVFFMIISFFLALLSIFINKLSGKIITSSGIFLIFSSFLQLNISGFFSLLSQELDELSENEKPIPSYLVRECIDNPDTPIRSYLTTKLFFDERTGFYFVIIAHIFFLIGIWV